MCVLVLFNRNDKIPYEDIASDTKIPEYDLLRALFSLSSGKDTDRVLVKEPQTEEIEPGHLFAVNEFFTSDTHKVKIASSTAERGDDPKRKHAAAGSVDAERRAQTEAAIVRIMKARRKLAHNELAVLVTTSLRSPYVPSPEDIKQRIEALIERDYLERSPDVSDVYIYVA